ncbi:MAG: hypothetical protein H7Y61_06700, partial [Rhizobiales bacterium]|nr:hypothetical protein [Rhizobacter sp.]
PLYLDLVVGAARPSQFRLDAAAGWLAFSADGRSWRAVTWSVQGLRSLAQPVFAPTPRANDSWASSSLLKLIVGADDQRQIELPKSLQRMPDQPRKAGP